MKNYFYGVYWVELDGEAVLCEVDGGTCYEAYRSKARAEKSAKRSTEAFSAHGAQYVARRIPAGVLIWDDVTHRKVITDAIPE
ncbi:hypothetical protein CUU54_02505 [Pectobacterium polaris]|uniref:hypothetical protein n=1 Tax=Pectobacterium polaris TaxID=2042057 RepID=UPI000D615848|nr:hypothetical protein [Pectobacterium polaris]MCU1787728.1 hypothetical protein [Pectobacterium polaris]PWD54860.1 hypothetical protein DF209_21480 [Pectobacterium polaris]